MGWKLAFRCLCERDTSGGKYPQLGPGNVSQVYDSKEDSIYELASAEIAAQGCRVFMYSEPMHYDGTLDHTEAQKIGKASVKVEKYEKYLGEREIVADIGIIQSDVADSLIVDHPIVARSIGRALEGGQHRKAILGAMKMCEYSKYTWRVVPELELTPELMKRFQMLLLPNLFYVSEELKEMLTAYVQEGGCLLISGETGLYNRKGELQKEFLLGELTGSCFVKKNETYKRNVWSAYVHPGENSVWKYCESTTPPVWEYTLETEGTGARGLGVFAYPATELTDTTWVNWGYPLPGRKTELPAIFCNHVGAGTVYRSALNFLPWKQKKSCGAKNCSKVFAKKKSSQTSIWIQQPEIFWSIPAMRKRGTGADSSPAFPYGISGRWRCGSGGWRRIENPCSGKNSRRDPHDLPGEQKIGIPSGWGGNLL